MTNRARDPYWDAVKGIGIMLVLLGHLTHYGLALSRVIFNFHMPLFFFVSGIFFRPEMIKDVSQFYRKIWNNLGVGWLYFAVIGAIFSLMFNGTLIPAQLGVKGALLRLWHGNPHVCNSLWFVTCLGVVQIAYWLLCRMFKGSVWCRDLVIGGCLLVLARMAANVAPHHKLYFPVQLTAIPMALFFFALGNRGGGAHSSTNCERRISTSCHIWGVGLSD